MLAMLQRSNYWYHIEVKQLEGEDTVKLIDKSKSYQVSWTNRQTFYLLARLISQIILIWFTKSLITNNSSIYLALHVPCLV